MQPSGNLLLESLPPENRAALEPFLRRVDLDHKTVLHEVGDKITTVYFPISAVISLVVNLEAGQMIEAAMVGRDGVVGAASALDSRTAISRAIVQLPGQAFTCEVGALRGSALQSQTLLSKLVRHEQMLFAQAQQSTACMAAHDVEARLCRWLLRARDLTNSDHLPLTQEFLAEMLGVTRSTVTVTAHVLQQAGMIKYARGKIQILNVEALKDTACECYEAVAGQCEMLLADQ